MVGMMVDLTTASGEEPRRSLLSERIELRKEMNICLESKKCSFAHPPKEQRNAEDK